MADLVAEGDLGQHFAPVELLDGFLLLVRSELRLATHLDAPCPCPLVAFTREGTDEFALELADAAKDRCQQTAVWLRRVGPCIGKGEKARFLCRDYRESVEEVVCGAGEAIKPRSSRTQIAAPPDRRRHLKSGIARSLWRPRYPSAPLH